MVPLSSVVRIVSGGTPKTSVESYWDGDIPWATPKDLSSLKTVEISNTPRKITAIGLSQSSAEILPANSVLFSSRAPIGLVAINSVPMATNQGFKSFVPIGGSVDSRYLYRWLRANRVQLQHLGVGATFKEVSKAIVSRLEIPLPSLDEQRRIAAILDKADDLRAKRHEALAHLDTLTQSIFPDMFGDRNFEPVPLLETCQVIVDCVNKTAPIVDYPTPFKMIRTTNVRNGEICLNKTRFVAEEIFNKWNSRAIPRRGDVILTREAPMGEAGILQSDEKVFLGQRTMLYRARPDRLTPEFLLHTFRSDEMQREYFKNGSGSTVKHLSVPYCRGLSIPTPPIELQKQFATRVAAVERLKDHHRAQLAELDALFTSLQHRAFNGTL